MNNIGISIKDKAIVRIDDNTIYQNSEEAIENSSKKKPKIGKNEMFDNGEGNASEENDETDPGFDLGNIFAKMFGSENISNDPNTIAIPLGHLFKEKDVEDDDENETEDDTEA